MLPLIYQPDPKWIHPENLEELKALAKTLVPQLKDWLAQAGFDLTLWSSVEDPELHCRHIATHGVLKGYIGLTMLMDKTPLTKEHLNDFPELVITHSSQWLHFITKQSWYITQDEDWWEGPHSFLVHDLYTYMLAQWHLKASNPHSGMIFRGWKSKAAERKDRAKAKVGPNPTWAAWIAHRAEGKVEVDALAREWKEAYDRAEELRLQLAELKSTLLTYEQFKQQN